MCVCGGSAVLGVDLGRLEAYIRHDSSEADLVAVATPGSALFPLLGSD